MSMCFNDDYEIEDKIDVSHEIKMLIKKRVREQFEKNNYAKLEEVALKINISFEEAEEAFNSLYKNNIKDTR